MFLVEGVENMQRTSPLPQFVERRILGNCPLPATALFEIHGARNRGCSPCDDYLFHGHRYLFDVNRDVLIRDDVSGWIVAQQRFARSYGRIEANGQTYGRRKLSNFYQTD